MIKIRTYHSYRHCMLDLVYQGCKDSGRIVSPTEVPNDPAIITVFDSPTLAVALDPSHRIYYSVDKVSIQHTSL